MSRAVDEILRWPGVQSGSAVILIDGRSGAGKTSLSMRLRDALPGASVLALDSVYPGWDGLRAGADQVLDRVLRPRAAGRDGTYTGWDWNRDVPADDHVVPASGPLIVEGAGLLTEESAGLADVRVWVEASDEERKRRALDRDGEAYAPHWERWSRQEERHIADHSPHRLADIVIEVPAG
nr:hypothetical protein [Microbacterium sp. NC79]